MAWGMPAARICLSYEFVQAKHTKQVANSKKHWGAIILSQVVRWLLESTCYTNKQLHSKHLVKEIDFCRQLNAQRKNAKFLSDIEKCTNLSRAYHEVT